jgi:hypothetical protein
MGLLICIALVLGFFLSWIIGIVAKEEVSISRSAVIVVLTTIIFFASFAASASLGIAGAIIPLGATTLAMGGLLKALAYIPFSKGVMVASVYSVIMVLLGFWLATM